MKDMLLSSFAFNHDIVNIHLYRVAYQRFEDFSHQSLISGASIFESEWHDFIAIEAVWRYECCFFFVIQGHGDLMISGEGIQEREHPLPRSGIHNLIYSWQGKAVFWTRIIEIGVIYTNSPFSFFFWVPLLRLPTNPGKKLLWWIRLRAIYQSRSGWFFVYPGGSA